MITTRAGEVFTVELEATPTSGHRWQPGPVPAEIEFLDGGFAAGAQVPGAAGTQSFRFRAGRRGSYALTFVLKRSWEADPAETRVLDIRVD
ncbi:MAG: protease inhibitor I42 family protein [Actinomycetales bacterium]